MSAQNLNDVKLTAEQKSIAEKLKKDIGSKTSYVGKPLFRKAVSVANNLTGFVDITIILPSIDRTSKIPQEYSLFSIPYNNVISFELTCSAGSTSGAEFTLVISDTTYKFMRIMYHRLYQIAQGKVAIDGKATPTIRITYGYPETSVEKYQKGKEYSQPILRQTIEGEITSIDTTVTLSKEEHTIKGNIGTRIYPAIESDFKPYTAYGSNILQLLNIHKFFEAYYDLEKYAAGVYKVYDEYMRVSKKFNKETREKNNNFFWNIIRGDDKTKNSSNINSMFEDINNQKPNISATEAAIDKYRPLTIRGILDKDAKNLEEINNIFGSYFSEAKVKSSEALKFILQAYIEQLKGYYKEKNIKSRVTIINMTGGFYSIVDTDVSPKDLIINAKTTWGELLKLIGSKCSLQIKMRDNTNKALNFEISKSEILNLSSIEVEVQSYTNTIEDKIKMTNIVNSLKSIFKAGVSENNPDYNSIKKDIDNILSDGDSNQFDFIILKPKTGNSFIETIGGLSSRAILNTYTIFPRKFQSAGSSKNYFNSGSAGLVNSSFPDVISFSPKMDYGVAINSIVTSALNTTDGKTGSGGTVEKSSDSLELYKQIKTNMLNESPIIVNPNSGVNNASILKKQKEILFNKALYTKASKIEATLEIFGEPALSTYASPNRYVLVKYYERSDELSPYSGFYTIRSLIHRVSNGKFTTTLALEKDITFGFDQIEGLNSLSAKVNNEYEEVDAKENLDEKGKAKVIVSKPKVVTKKSK